MDRSLWTRECEKIFLDIKSNGGLLKTIELIKSIIGERGNRWDFVGNCRIYVKPPIKVLRSEKSEILKILQKNGLLAN